MLDHGGRIELKLRDVEARSVGYAVVLSTPAGLWNGEARVQLGDGKVDIGGFREPEAPPTWLLQTAHGVLRGLYRSHRDAGGWPKRVTRWRTERGA